MELDRFQVHQSLEGRVACMGSPRAYVVDEFVAVKALWNHSEPQLSTAWSQRIQSKVVIFTRFQQTSICRKIWFGTRGSEVQILSSPTNIIYNLQTRDPHPLVLAQML